MYLSKSTYRLKSNLATGMGSRSRHLKVLPILLSSTSCPHISFSPSPQPSRILHHARTSPHPLLHVLFESLSVLRLPKRSTCRLRSTSSLSTIPLRTKELSDRSFTLCRFLFPLPPRTFRPSSIPILISLPLLETSYPLCDSRLSRNARIPLQSRNLFLARKVPISSYVRLDSPHSRNDSRSPARR